MNEPIFILRGDICYSRNLTELAVIKQGYVICKEGMSLGVYQELPEEYQDLPVRDCGDDLILPGLCDLHVHAPQYTFRGLGMDLELLDWLNEHAFPEEGKYRNLEYARKAYGSFVQNLKESATTRACIFGTIHVPATELLMDMLEASGLHTIVGKVNMDRNCPAYLTEKSADISAEDTVEWIKDCKKRRQITRPILTPRFIPSCSDALMENLKKVQMHFGLPVQSHLSENQSEVAWVQELCPQSEFYGDAYDRFGLFGADCSTVMAHCVYSDERERRRMKENGVYVAHCPESNMNLSSGIAPVRAFLNEGIPVGLGSDVAGGTSEDIFAAMAHAIQASKLRWRLVDDTLKPLTAIEAFYLGTKGGGSFFGKVGSLEEGYEFDALIVDDSAISSRDMEVKERLERLIYLSGGAKIKGKYVAGKEIFWR